MRILPISFNSNYKSSKNNQYQTHPISLKADTVEFSKNVSFKGNLSTEEEILALDKKARKQAHLKQAITTPEILEDAFGYLEDAKYMWVDAQKFGEINKKDNTLIHKVYIGDKYCEWVFDSKGDLKSLSNLVCEKDGTKEIEERFIYINGNELESYERKIQEDTRHTKIGEVFEFCKNELVEYITSKTISQNGITHKKESFNYHLNGLSHYVSDLVEGNDWYTFGEKLNYDRSSNLLKYSKNISYSKRGYEYEQISYFKDGKLYKTRENE